MRPSEFHQLLGQRIIKIASPITDDSANVVIAQMLFLDSEDPTQPIRLELQTPGGSVGSALAILDTMDALHCPVHTVATGLVAGVAVNLLAHGTPGERVAARHARILFTPITSSEGAPLVNEIRRTEAFVVDFLTKDTRRERERVLEDLRAGRAFGAAEAVAYGLIDRVA